MILSWTILVSSVYPIVSSGKARAELDYSIAEESYSVICCCVCSVVALLVLPADLAISDHVLCGMAFDLGGLHCVRALGGQVLEEGLSEIAIGLCAPWSPRLRPFLRLSWRPVASSRKALLTVPMCAGPSAAIARIAPANSDLVEKPPYPARLVTIWSLPPPSPAPAPQSPAQSVTVGC